MIEKVTKSDRFLSVMCINICKVFDVESISLKKVNDMVVNFRR